MKLIGEYTARGRIEHQEVERIILFDGAFDTAFRITSFVVYPSGNASSQDCAGILATDEDALSGNTVADFSDNRQIGWSNSRVQDNFSAQGPLEIIDPDNLIVQDLYVQVQSNALAGNYVNYMIKMEKYSIPDYEGAYAMVRARSQS